MTNAEETFTAVQHLEDDPGEVPGDFHAGRTGSIMSVRICVNVPAYGCKELYCTCNRRREHVWIA